MKTFMGRIEFTFMVAAIFSIIAAAIDGMLPALGQMGTDLQVSDPNQVQWIVTSLFLGMAFTTILHGLLTDRYGRKLVMLLGLVLYIIGAAFCYFATDLTMMLVGRFIQGMGAAAPQTAALAVIRDRFVGREMAKTMSFVMVIFIMMPMVAPAIGLGLMKLGNWHNIFLAFILYPIVIALWVKFRLTETLKPEDVRKIELAPIWSAMKTIFANPRSVCFMLSLGLFFGLLTSYLNFGQQIFRDLYGIEDMFAFYFSLLATGFGAGALSNSWLVMRLGMQRLVNYASAILLINASVFIVIVFWLPAPPLGMFLAFMAVNMICMSFSFANINALTMEPYGHMAGIATSVINTSQSFLSLFIGSLISQSYHQTLHPLAIGAFIIASLMFFLIRKASRYPVPNSEPIS